MADRHHQESLAPFLVVENLLITPENVANNQGSGLNQLISVSGTLKNVGGGPATHITLKLTYSRREISEPQRLVTVVGDHGSEPLKASVFIRVDEMLSHRDNAAFLYGFELAISYRSAFNTTRTTTYTKRPFSEELNETTTPVLIDQRLRPRIRQAWEWPY